MHADTLLFPVKCICMQIELGILENAEVKWFKNPGWLQLLYRKKVVEPIPIDTIWLQTDDVVCRPCFMHAITSGKIAHDCSNALLS